MLLRSILVFSFLAFLMGCSDRPSDLPFSKTEFLEWRSPRRGDGNPQAMTNPVWRWIIENKLDAYSANETAGGPGSFDAGPCFSAARFGQSETALPDGRVLLVAGEHEDFYDPDFYIYNDVIVRHPDGRLEIFGYSEEAFPPTDFHSATRVDDLIWLVGNLGYDNARKVGSTQVLHLDVNSLQISKVETTGDRPGWIHRHEATYDAPGNTIRINGGEVDDGTHLIENIDEWELNLKTLVWKRLTRKSWERRIFARKDGSANDLYEARQILWWESLPEEYQKQMQRFSDRDFDNKLLAQLYTPNTPHEVVEEKEDEDEYNVYRIKIDGVVVRFVEESAFVAMTIEGELPEPVVQELVQHLTTTLEKFEKKPYTSRSITH